jgi:hypothetical protein
MQAGGVVVLGLLGLLFLVVFWVCAGLHWIGLTDLHGGLNILANFKVNYKFSSKYYNQLQPLPSYSNSQTLQSVAFTHFRLFP